MLRTVRERVLQTLCFEVGGLIISVPIFAYFTQTGQTESLMVLIVVSLAVMCWTGIHNFIFDWFELRYTARVASDRPNGMRIVHAISHEASSVVVSLPVLMWLSGLNWKEALIADIGLTLLYAGYALVFYRLYDALRPVQNIQLQGMENDY